MIEEIILANLIENERYLRKVLPYMQVEYFTQEKYKNLFSMIQNYVVKYNDLPTKEALFIALFELSASEEQKEQCDDLIVNLKINPDNKFDWLIDESEKFCQERALYLALSKSLEIMREKGKENAESVGAIPNILTKAVGLSFDSHVGHHYFEDAAARYDKLHSDQFRIPYDIENFDLVTKGGCARKTLTIFMAGVNVGKSAFMCSMAANNLRQGKKILYITLEMSEEAISERIDANLIDLTLTQVFEMDRDTYLHRVETVKGLYGGDIIVKEYPTRSAGSANFRFLLNELKLKKNFVPDIVYVDYLNICCSSTVKNGKASLYEYVKAISEELRGLAVEYDLPFVTATQFNRTGFKSSDPGMEDSSESFGTQATGDEIFALVRTEELDKEGQIMVKRLKTRSTPISYLTRFTIGVNIEKMKFFDVEGSPMLNESAVEKQSQDFYNSPVTNSDKFSMKDISVMDKMFSEGD